jgi:hypothetical protein
LQKAGVVGRQRRLEDRQRPAQHGLGLGIALLEVERTGKPVQRKGHVVVIRSEGLLHDHDGPPVQRIRLIGSVLLDG